MTPPPKTGAAGVSPVCERVTQWNPRTEICGKPTAFWYPAHGGGTMALCRGCAQPHERTGHLIGLTPYTPEASR